MDGQDTIFYFLSENNNNNSNNKTTIIITIVIMIMIIIMIIIMIMINDKFYIFEQSCFINVSKKPWINRMMATFQFTSLHYIVFVGM